MCGWSCVRCDEKNTARRQTGTPGERKRKAKESDFKLHNDHYAGRGDHAQEMRHKEILAPDWGAPVCGGVVAVQDPIGNIGAGGAVDAAVAVMPSGHIGWVATVLESVPGIKLAVGVPGVV